MADANTLNVRVIIKHGTAANWTKLNPILLAGEMGIVVDDTKDNGKYKIGDGVTAWNNLKYSSSNSTIVKNTVPSSSDYNYDVGQLWVNSSNGVLYSLISASGTTGTWQKLGVTSEDIISNFEEYTASEIDAMWTEVIGGNTVLNGYKLTYSTEQPTDGVRDDDVWINY